MGLLPKSTNSNNYSKAGQDVGRAFVSAYKQAIRCIWVFTVTVFVGCLIWLAVALHASHVETQDIGMLVAGFFVIAGLPISIWEIGMHLQHYTRPDLQKFIIRILWMVPIYAISSWLALSLPKHAIIFDTMRGCYEAYVIYSFYMYLVTFLGDLHGEDQIIDMLERKPEMEHDHYFPFCWMAKTRMGEPFLHMCRRGVLMYVAIRLVTALLAFPLAMAGHYGEGNVDFSKGYIYLSIFNNMGAGWAMYCLFVFYMKLRTELEPIRPGFKFLCVKAVVFFSYWQGCILAMLAWNGVLHKTNFTEDNWRVKDIQTGCQNFLICCEMFFAAIAHHYAFSYREFVPEEEHAANASRPWYDMLGMMLDVEDVRSGFHEEIPDEMSASAEYHIDEQARLLQKVANDTPAITWVLQNCFGHRKEKATPPVEGTRQIPEDYGQDDNSWQDAP